MFSIRVAVLEAWIELESASASKAASFRRTSNTTLFERNLQLGSYFHQCGLLNEQQLKSFNERHQLRNKLVHCNVTNLKESDAKDYIAVASNLANKIRIT